MSTYRIKITQTMQVTHFVTDAELARMAGSIGMTLDEFLVDPEEYVPEALDEGTEFNWKWAENHARVVDTEIQLQPCCK